MHHMRTKKWVAGMLGIVGIAGAAPTAAADKSCQTAGAFAGTFDGSNSGPIGLLVDAGDGSVTGAAAANIDLSGTQQVQLDQASISGSAGPAADFEADLTADGSLTGTWSSPDLSGTLSASRVGSAGDATARFTGQFSGDATGSIVFDVDAQGAVTGAILTEDVQVLDTFNGTVSGGVLNATTTQGASLTGPVDTAGGAFNGSWTLGSLSGQIGGTGCQIDEGSMGGDVSISEVPLPNTGEVVAAAANPHDPSIVVASTAPSTVGQEGTGIFRSMNGGQSWELIREGHSPTEFHFSRSDRGTVLATGPGETDAESEANFTYLSSLNAGASWDVASVTDATFGNTLSATRVYIDPADATEWWFISRNAIGGGLYRSTNNGNSWTRAVEDPFFMAEVVSPIEAPDTVFLISWQAGANAILKSVDNGRSFHQASNGISTSTVDSLISIGVSRSGQKLTSSRHLSVNGGANWTSASVTGTAVFAKGAIWQIRDNEVAVSEDNAQSWSIAVSGQFPEAVERVSSDVVTSSRAFRDTIHYFQVGPFEEDGRLFVIDISGYGE